MAKNTLEKIFYEFNKNRIKYCIRGKYRHLPKTLNGGDVDTLIERKDFPQALKIIRKLGFKFYPHTDPNLFYFYYDFQLGLVHLDILLIEKMVPIKKHKTFFIPADEKPIPNRKNFLWKIKTSIMRKLHYLFRGPVIVFEGPDGSGKSSNLREVLEAIKRIKLKKDKVHFATPFKGNRKPSSLDRLISRTRSLLRVYKNKILGRVSITDRYIYLTFRKSNPLLRKLLRFLAPKPTLVFVMKASIKTIRRRKKGQRDNLSPEELRELYRVYDSIPRAKFIDTEKPIKENLGTMVNLMLEKTLI